jgi:hypothetical protein
METFKAKFKQALVDNDINASGKLDNSTEDIIVSSDNFVSGSVRALTYWKYPNFGRGGATRSSAGKGIVKESIKKWIEDKGLPVWKRKKKDGSEGSNMTRDEQAFLITRKIQRDGYDGKNFVEPIIEEIQPDVDRLIRDAVFEDLKIMLPEWH